MKNSDKQKLQSFGGGAFSASLASRSAFTLAEMMVVLLIMSIVLACMAPVMTTKMKSDQSIQTSPWRWSDNNVDAYFSAGSNQAAMIGQNAKDETDNSKLIINNSTNLDDMILFKNGANTLGHLRVTSDLIQLGTVNTDSEQGAVNVRSGFAISNDSLAFGDLSRSGNRGASFGLGAQSGSGSVTVGNSSVSESNAVSLGYNSYAHPNAIIIGNSTNAYDSSIVIGHNINNTSQNSVSIGNGSIVADVGGTALGDSAEASHLAVALGSYTSAHGTGSIAIGPQSMASKESSIAIGALASAGTSSIMIGVNAGKANTTGYQNTVIGANAFIHNTTGSSNVAVGQLAMQENTTGFGNVAFGTDALNANKTSNYNTAIGHYAGSSATGANNIMLGSFAGQSLGGSNNIAIGSYACQYVTGSNKTCIGNSSGPSSNHDWAKDSYERIFIGSKSSFNGGPAALEVHNGIPGDGFTISSSRGLAGTVVVVNGALLVKGGIITSMPWVDDNRFASNGGVNLIGRTGGQLEPVDVDWNGTSNQVSGEYGGADRGTFKSPNSHDIYGFSDRRLKYVGKENLDGLAKLRQVKVFNYTFKKDETKTPRVGVIAQDLQKIFPNAVKKGADGFLSIRMEDMFYAVINAIKELDAKYQAQEKRIDELEKRIKALEAKIK